MGEEDRTLSDYKIMKGATLTTEPSAGAKVDMEFDIYASAPLPGRRDEGSFEEAWEYARNQPKLSPAAQAAVDASVGRDKVRHEVRHAYGSSATRASGRGELEWNLAYVKNPPKL